MESQQSSGLTRRRLMRLGTLSVGGVIAASTAASASTVPVGPGQDGASDGDPRVRVPAARAAASAPPAVARSYNGWTVGRTAASIGVRSYLVPGTSIPLTVRSGDVATVFMYLAGRFNSEVEKLRPGQDWGYEYRVDVNNPKWWSCHASGTAVDLNAVLHPNGARGTFNPAQVKKLRKILSDCGGVIYWGGDFSGIPDEMHFEINVPPGDPRLPALAARIGGGRPVPPAPPVQTQPDRTIALLAIVNNRFVTADIGSHRPLIANQSVIGGAEQYQVVTLDGNTVALLSRANNRFVCAEQAGAAPLIANRDQVGTWESFTIVTDVDGTVSLRSAVNGRFVTADGRGSKSLVASRTSIGTWEKFSLTVF